MVVYEYESTKIRPLQRFLLARFALNDVSKFRVASAAVRSSVRFSPGESPQSQHTEKTW
jgi:hypothetical protein